MFGLIELFNVTNSLLLLHLQHHHVHRACVSCHDDVPASHMQDRRATTPTVAVHLSGLPASVMSVTTSKLPAGYHLALLTSLPFEICPEKQSWTIRYGVKATAWNFWPAGDQGNRKFPPQKKTCHSPWRAVGPEMASRPRLRSLTFPQAAVDGKAEEGGGKNSSADVRCVIEEIFFSPLFKTSSTLYFTTAAVCCCESPWRGQGTAAPTIPTEKGNINVPNNIGKSDKQEDLHLKEQGHWQTYTAYGSRRVRWFASEAGRVYLWGCPGPQRRVIPWQHIVVKSVRK